MKKNDTILVVDDMEVNRAVICGIFEKNCNILEAENGRQAIEILSNTPNITVVLLDIIMPDMDGYQVLKWMSEHDLIENIPVVVITADVSPEMELVSFDMGALDIISKPFEPYVVKRRVENMIELYRHKLHLEELVKEQALQLKESNEIIVDALSSVIESRSLESGQHIFRIRMFTKILLQEMAKTDSNYNLSEHTIDLIASASSMHDIGKIAIPDSILNKPGKLTREEFEIMKTHTVKGCKILKSLDKMPDKEYLMYAFNICRYHHERYDGGGYPDGIKGENIPICAQAVSVADVYDALTTDRVYKSAFPHQKAIDMIMGEECGVFSPKILKCLIKVSSAFEKLAKKYADGSFVSPVTSRENLVSFKEGDLFSKENMDQLRLQTMLHYLNCIAIEFDLNSEYFNILYAPVSEKDMLKSNGAFSKRSEFMTDFINNRVHPEDIENVIDFISARYDDFNTGNNNHPSHEFRARSASGGEYGTYRATFLRIKTETPQYRKIIVLLENITVGLLPPASEEIKGDENIFEALQHSYTMTAVSNLTKDTFVVLHSDKTVSSEVGQIVSYSEMIGNLEQNLIHPDDRNYFLKNFSLKNMIKHFSHSDKNSVLYRYLGTDNKYHWREHTLVRDANYDNGDLIIYSLIRYADSSETDGIIASRRDAIFGREIYPILLDKFKDIIFEYDLKKGTTYYSNGFEEKFGMRPPSNMREIYSSAKSNINKEDRDDYINSIKDLDEQPDIRDIEFRYKNAEGKYIWCRKRFLITRDENGFALKVNGIMTDVDRYKQENAILKVKSQTDQLTGLYNKITVQNKIDRFLTQSDQNSMHALFILDIDNFKIVNDIYGHLTGDKTLEKISNQISVIFEDNGIMGRVGGDEFIIFIKNIPNEEFARSKAQTLLDRLNEILASFYKTTSISVSIGISFFPCDSDNFIDLFTKADLALYEAKRLGKSQWRVYKEGMKSNSSLIKYTPADARGEHSIIDDFTVSLLKNFYGFEDPADGIQFVFDAVARYCGLDHIYIYENYSGVKKLYEWNAKTSMRFFDYTSVKLDEQTTAEFIKLGKDKMILSFSDTSVLSPRAKKYFTDCGVSAILQMPVQDKKMEYGFIGFSEHEQTRDWTEQEKDILSYLSRTAALVYLKTQHMKSMEEKYTMSNLFFNQIDTIGYVINETFSIIEANNSLRAKLPFEPGIKCYKLFQNNTKPCLDCPVLKLNKSCRHASSQMYLDLYSYHVKVSASYFETGQHNTAYLITVNNNEKTL